MKHSSNVMYRFGHIFNTIQLALGPVLFIIGLVLAIVGGVQDPVKQALVDAGWHLIRIGVYFVVAAILCIIFVGKALKELTNRDSKDPTPFILTIVFGAIANNPFYVLAGVFGLIADGQDRRAEEPKEVEQKEEPKE